ncbi:hypothetical protein AB205_0018850, partial [Aquarana catesbeiana]
VRLTDKITSDKLGALSVFQYLVITVLDASSMWANYPPEEAVYTAKPVEEHPILHFNRNSTGEPVSS